MDELRLVAPAPAISPCSTRLEEKLPQRHTLGRQLVRYPRLHPSNIPGKCKFTGGTLKDGRGAHGRRSHARGVAGAAAVHASVAGLTDFSS
jgi:hypothetical protein